MIQDAKYKIIYQGNGLAKEFPYPFALDQKSNIKVVLIDPYGIETLLVKDYFVDDIKNSVFYPGYSPGEEPPENEQPPPVQGGWRLLLYRDIPVTQEVDFGNKWPMYIIEKAFDKVTILIQQVMEKVSRTIIFPISELFEGTLPSPIKPNASICINETGDGLRYGADPDDAERAVQIAEDAKDIAKDAKTIAEGIDGKAQQALDNSEDTQDIVDDLEEQISKLGVGYAPQYDNAKTYQRGDLVVVGANEIYRCLEASTGEYPPSSSKWEKMVSVINEAFVVDAHNFLVPSRVMIQSTLWRVDNNGFLTPNE